MIDGKKIGTIANGESQTIDVPAGSHTLHFKIDWTRSPVETFEVAAGECRTFEVSGFKNAKWLLPLGVIISILAPVLAKLTEINDLIFLGVPIFLILMFYITFGRKKYLNIKAVVEE